MIAAFEIDALEKATRRDVSAVQQFAPQLLGEWSDSPEKIIRWHVAQLLPRLQLGDRARRVRRRAILERWLDDDPSAIVRVNAVQALYDLCGAEPELRARVRSRLLAGMDDKSAAMRARARKLLQSFSDMR